MDRLFPGILQPMFGLDWNGGTLSDLEVGKDTGSLGLVLRITRELGGALFVAPAEQRERFRRVFVSTS